MKKIVDCINLDLVREVVEVTPLELAQKLSARFDNAIYYKREDTTAVHSFKLRGAYHKIAKLSDKEKKLGVVASSAGNHAQGVAFSAKKLGISALIVMPKATADIKIEAVKTLGAQVELFGDGYEQARQQAEAIAAKTGRIAIHPFDDIEVIAGQATIAVELSQQLPNADYIFIPVGGGGLITGIGAYIKSKQLKTKIIAVEPEKSNAMAQAKIANKHERIKNPNLFAEGVAVEKIGNHAFDLMNSTIDDNVLVSNDEICAAIKDIYNDTRSIVETSGALSVAGTKRYIEENNIQGKKIITILSGANLNFDRLRHIAERAEIGEHKEALFAITLKEEKGGFLQFCQDLNHRSITEFNYRRSDAKQAHIFVGVGLDYGEQRQEIIAQLTSDYQVQDLTEDELAKTHIRYMVGGAKTLKNEVLYRFSFPEQPGALLDFLQTIGTNWNISLFHYRNHGADFGRVLVGFQADNIANLENQLNKLNYSYHNETNNIAYRYFLM